jgi:receptor protein-tyrosine kinase
MLVAALAPSSLPAEEYRALRTRIAQAENGRPLRVILVTSPVTGDGKTITSANLALTMAQEFNRRVLLVDGDLRKPGVHALFDLPVDPGLSDVLAGGATIEETILPLTAHRLSVLPAGRPAYRPAELLGSAAMRNLLRMLGQQFDRIIVDMPPATPLADVGILLPHADGVLMVVRAGRTPKPTIERALAEVEASKLLGLVLNDSGDLDPHRYGPVYLAGRGGAEAGAARARD